MGPNFESWEIEIQTPAGVAAHPNQARGALDHLLGPDGERAVEAVDPGTGIWLVTLPTTIHHDPEADYEIERGGYRLVIAGI